MLVSTLQFQHYTAPKTVLKQKYFEGLCT